MLRLQRIYEPPGAEDGDRYLVERLWPRGVSRQSARLTAWLKDLAPSPALRQWYHHDPARWPEFQRRYEAELQAPAAQAQLHDLAQQSLRGPVTLVFAARDPERNSAAVLARLVSRVARKLRGPSP